MLLKVLFILITVSFSFHGVSLALYIFHRTMVAFVLYLVTTAMNLFAGGVIFVILFNNPELADREQISWYLWILSGVLSAIIVYIQISIFLNVFKRMMDPKFYRYNFFGRKVYGKDVVSRMELSVFFATVPFFMFSSAWFVARLYNLVTRGHI